MSEIFSKNTIKESSSNLFLLILTLSMLSFFAFGDNRLGAFFITFLISFLSISVLLFYVYKKERANFELRKKDNIAKLLSLRKEPEQIAKDIEVQEHTTLESSYILLNNAIKNWNPIHTSVNLDIRENYSEWKKRHNYKFVHVKFDSPYQIDIVEKMGIDLFDSSLPSVLNQFGKILDNDNGIQNYRYTDNDVNNLILKMNVCKQNIQGRYIHNEYSKEMTVTILQSAIDYLKEKDNVPVYGNPNPFLPLYK
ncbi:MAG: hypothetical protein Q8O62_04390 [Aequorivita sp.]|nr:hypothetical protein [Aequorivita sp.]